MAPNLFVVEEEDEEVGGGGRGRVVPLEVGGAIEGGDGGALQLRPLQHWVLESLQLLLWSTGCAACIAGSL